MKKSFKAIIMIVSLVALSSCSSTQSLQEYFVDSSEDPNYLSVDLPASILNLDKVELSGEQKKAISSLRKLNILAFKKTDTNVADYKTEKQKVSSILKNDKYTTLMKLNSQYGKGEVKYLGSEDAIDEVIIYGNSEEKGFAVVRVLGKDMNPAYLINLLQAIEKSDYNGEGLEGLGNLFKG